MYFFCWIIFFSIFIMYVWQQEGTISSVYIFYEKSCYFKIMPMVFGGEVDWATRCSQCDPSVLFISDFHHFHFLNFSFRNGPLIKLFDVSGFFKIYWWLLEIKGTILCVYFWYGKQCYFKVIKNGGWWGGGWSEMRLATFIAFCLFQIFKRPITFIF